MKVQLEDQLVNYMHDHHHDILTLKLIHDTYGGTDVFTTHPSIRYKKPRHVEDFTTYHVDDITVYVSNEIKAKDETIKFIDEKMLGIHRCHVVGLDQDFITSFFNH